MESNSLELMSRDEECCLKTALAFAVLRKRLENDDSQQEPSFLRGLISSSISTLPPSHPTDHLAKMMNVAIATATPLCSDNGKQTHSFATLEGICKHLALQLRNSNAPAEWIQDTLARKEKEIVAVSTVWHCILQAEPSIGAKLLPAIGQVLQDLYHNDKQDTALQMVKVVELAEACVSIRLPSTCSQSLVEELHQALGAELCLPIATKDLAYFVLQQQRGGFKKPGNKILLRFCLYDLMEKLSARP